MDRIRITTIIYLLLVLSSSITAGTTGKLSGTIKSKLDESPLIGANIMIENTGLGTATDLKGDYVILNIPPGKYNVTIRMIGYEVKKYENIRISIDKTTRLFSTLDIEAVKGQEVIVNATRPLIDFDKTNSEAIVTSEELDIMPIEDVADVIKLQGGVTQDAGGGIHIRGGRSSEVAYLVDGVSVTDAYDGAIAVNIENANIQELQVISGTFNAEYGKAMSGIVNIVTKDGSDKLESYLQIYSGDHQSDDNIYKDLRSYNITNDKNITMNLSGPIIKQKLNFFISARSYVSDGWLNGLQTFTMYGDTIHTDNNSNGYFDSTDTKKEPYYRSMNWRDKYSIQTKLTYKLNPKLILRLNSIVSNEEWQNYDHYSQMAQEGQNTNYAGGNFIGLKLSQSFSSRTFYDININQSVHDYNSYLYNDPIDKRYITPDHLFWRNVSGAITPDLSEKYGMGLNFFPQYTFSRWGVNTGRFFRRTTTNSFKWDLTSQINKYNQIKLGFEFQRHLLEQDGYALLDSSQSDQIFTPSIPEKNSFNRTTYEFDPIEGSFYIQDKIEYGDMIINAGIRYEYFDPRSYIPNNIHEPYIKNPRNPALDSLSMEDRENLNWGSVMYTVEDSIGNPITYTYADYYQGFGNQENLYQKTGWWKKTTVKNQISPRLGIAYPISDRGVVHFSYGYFFKIPDFSLLYNNTEVKLTDAGTDFGIFGNPDLKPERSVSYEIGLQQELLPNLKLDLRAYYKDSRDYVSSGIPIDLGDGKSYYTYVNKDYSNTRGIIITLDRFYQNGFGWHIDYTYQKAEGSNSDPSEEFGAVVNGQEPTRSIIPLDWDQNNNLNGSFFFDYNGWVTSLLFQYGSGYPFTPVITNYEGQGGQLANVLIKNSRRKLYTYNFDLKISRGIKINNFKGKLFININNLLDTRNEISVYGDTGRANRTIEQVRANIISPYEPMRPHSLDDYFSRPDWYSEPRSIQLGLELRW